MGTWIGPGGATISGNIVVTDSHVFVQSGSATHAVNLSTRSIDWSYPAFGDIAIGDGVLAIVDDAAVHVFSITLDLSLPVAPLGLTASRVVGSQATFRFTPPTAGAVPTGYVLEGGVSPGQTLVSLPLAAVPEHTINVPSGAYYVRVRAVAGGVVSAASNEIRIFVNQPVLPSPPASLTVLVSGSSLRLAWKNTFQGGAVDRVRIDVTGSLTTSVLLGPVETFAFDGVPSGTYGFTVRAQNAAGTSGSSANVSLVSPGPCSGPPQSPPGFIAYRVGNVARLSWDPPASGPAPESYRVNVTGSLTGTFSVTGRSLSGTLGAGTYHVSVAAVNLCGTSPAAAVQTVVVP